MMLNAIRRVSPESSSSLDLLRSPAATEIDTVLSLSLVIPTYNERQTLPDIVDSLTTVLDRAVGAAYEIIVVDDDSPDETWKVAQQLVPRYPRLRVLRRRRERGLATAVLRGWQASRGAVLGVIDADLQHPPEVAAELWGRILCGADLALASRHTAGGGVSHWPLYRRVFSRAAQLLGLVLVPSVFARTTDPMSGCFMVRRDAIAGLPMSPLGYKILIEVLARGNVRSVAEVGYVFRERERGTSKVTMTHCIEYMRHLLRLRMETLTNPSNVVASVSDGRRVKTPRTPGTTSLASRAQAP